MQLNKRKPPLFVSFFRSNNNFFITLSLGAKISPFFSNCAGVLGLSGSRRDSPVSAQLAGRAIAKEVRLKGYSRFYLKIRGGFDNTVKGFLRGIKSSALTVMKIYHIRPASHNGIRLKKHRRM